MKPENVDSRDEIEEVVEQEKKKKNPFIVGSLWGLIVGFIIGVVTYPWGRGDFEGASAYHMFYMIFILHCITIGCGVLNVFLDEFCKDK